MPQVFLALSNQCAVRFEKILGSCHLEHGGKNMNKTKKLVIDLHCDLSKSLNAGGNSRARHINDHKGTRR